MLSYMFLAWDSTAAVIGQSAHFDFLYNYTQVMTNNTDLSLRKIFVTQVKHKGNYP